jgi:hypothetical protein
LARSIAIRSLFANGALAATVKYLSRLELRAGTANLSTSSMEEDTSKPAHDMSICKTPNRAARIRMFAPPRLISPTATSLQEQSTSRIVRVSLQSGKALLLSSKGHSWHTLHLSHALTVRSRRRGSARRASRRLNAIVSAHQRCVAQVTPALDRTGCLPLLEAPEAANHRCRPGEVAGRDVADSRLRACGNAGIGQLRHGGTTLRSTGLARSLLQLSHPTIRLC